MSLPLSSTVPSRSFTSVPTNGASIAHSSFSPIILVYSLSSSIMPCKVASSRLFNSALIFANWVLVATMRESRIFLLRARSQMEVCTCWRMFSIVVSIPSSWNSLTSDSASRRNCRMSFAGRRKRCTAVWRRLARDWKRLGGNLTSLEVLLGGILSWCWTITLAHRSSSAASAQSQCFASRTAGK